MLQPSHSDSKIKKVRDHMTVGHRAVSYSDCQLLYSALVLQALMGTLFKGRGWMWLALNHSKIGGLNDHSGSQ